VTTTVPDGASLDRGNWHFHRRLWERYGVWRLLAHHRRHPRRRAVLLRKGPRGKPGSRYAVKLRSGCWIKVLVGKRHVPVSALPWR
jgi:hypothetical protein